ncbi:hypothetical protein ACFU53_06920 [Streptomyces sp. NPDC057474]|uniref:hypothetical protein n=1 Tax=Streptomyces sp. NPDC057474 TaxID=3346144 RepID=UPI0036D028A9
MDEGLAALIAGVASLIGGLAGARMGSKATIASARYKGRQEAYHALTTALNQFRHSLEANDFTQASFEAADRRVHDVVNDVSREGPPKVAKIAKDIRLRCLEIRQEVEGGNLGSLDQRVAAWRARILPLRDDLDEAIFKHGI